MTSPRFSLRASDCTRLHVHAQPKRFDVTQGMNHWHHLMGSLTVR